MSCTLPIGIVFANSNSGYEVLGQYYNFGFGVIFFSY